MVKPKPNQEKIIVRWAEIDLLIDVLTNQIIGVDSVYGIPRGGLVPAVMLSHRLGLPLVQKIGKNTLIVDDISDSGKTLNKLNKPNKVAVLMQRKNTEFKCDFVGKHIDHEDWLVFPWET